MTSTKSVGNPSIAYQETVTRLVEGGAEQQVAESLAGRMTRSTNKPDHSGKASREAFLSTILSLSRGRSLTMLK